MNIIKLNADEIDNYDLIVSLLKGKDEITIYDINDFRENKTKLLLDEFAKLFKDIFYIPLVEIYPENQSIRTEAIYDITDMYPNIPYNILNKIVPILMFCYCIKEDGEYQILFNDKLIYRYNKQILVTNYSAYLLNNNLYHVVDLIRYNHNLVIHYDRIILPVTDTLCNYGLFNGYKDENNNKMLLRGKINLLSKYQECYMIDKSGLISNDIYLSRTMRDKRVINISGIRFRCFWNYIPFEIYGNYIIIPEGSKPSLSVYKNYGIIPVIIEELAYDRKYEYFLYQISTGMDTNFIKTKEKYNTGKLEMICLK